LIGLKYFVPVVVTVVFEFANYHATAFSIVHGHVCVLRQRGGGRGGEEEGERREREEEREGERGRERGREEGREEGRKGGKEGGTGFRS
jgi:hypothetical protein